MDWTAHQPLKEIPYSIPDDVMQTNKERGADEKNS